MPLVVADRVRETTTTAGTGTVTLAGAVLGFQSFAVIGNGNTTYYTIAGQGTTEWEVGIGTYTSSGTTLSRDTVLANSLGTTAKINFSAGTKDIFVTYPAGRSVYSNGTNIVPDTAAILLPSSGGTGLSSFTANGIVYASSTSALTTGSSLTFNGSTLATTGALTVDGNATLGNATSDTVTVNGYMGVGAAATANSGRSITIQSAALTGNTQIGVYSNITGTSAATTGIDSFYSVPSTANATYTAARVSGFYADTAVKLGSSTITNAHGVYIADQTNGTNNYGVTSLVSSGAGTSWNIYASGTAPNYFAGSVGIGTTAPIAPLHVALPEVGGEAVRLSWNSGSTTQGAASIGFSTTQSATYSNAVISGQEIDTSDYRGNLLFYTRDTNSDVAPIERMRIDDSGNVGIGTNGLGTTTDTRTVTIASNGYAVLRVNGDYSNTAGEPGGSAVVFAVDGSTARQGLVSFVNTAGTSGDSSTAYTGTASNSMLVGTTGAQVLQLGTNGSVGAALTTTSDFQFDSGYGSVATAYGCRAWVNFNGTGTVAIRGDANVSSITDNAGGNYTVNYTTSMPDTNYAVQTSGSQSNSATNTNRSCIFIISRATGSTQIMTVSNETSNASDYLEVHVAIFR